MADDLDNMSDADIRTRLSEFGFPVVPITATTRKTMVKKLRMLIENQKKISKSSRMSLAKYSSGEDSDVDTNKKVTDKSRRYTTVGQMLPPVTKKAPTPVKTTPPIPNKPSSPPRQTRQSTIRDLTNDLDNESSGGEEPVKTRRVTRLYKTTTTTKEINNSNYNDSVSDSDDDVEIVETQTEKQSSVIDRDSPSLSLHSSPSKQSPSSTSTSWKSDIYKPYSTSLEPKSVLSNRTTLHTSSVNRSETIDYSPSDRYGRSSQTSESVNIDYNSAGDHGSEDKYESPFLSEFTRKLESTKRQYSVLTPPNKNTTLLSDDSGVSYSPTRDIARSPITSVNNTHNNYRTFSSYSRRPVPSRTNSALENIFKKSNIIPLVLVVAVAVFFTFVGFMYLGMKGRTTFQIDSRDHNIPICKKAVSSDVNYGGRPSRPGVNCVIETSVAAALNLFKFILPELNNRAVDYICQNTKNPPYMTSVDITEFVKKDNPRMEPERVLSDLDNLHVLILKNPQWGASIIDKTDHTILTSLDEILKSETYQNIAIKISNPDLPLYCIFANKLVNIVYTAALVISGLVVAIGLQFIIKFGLKKREERNKAVYAMVERIVEVLSQESGDGDDSYMAINHVRDRLILPQERKNMSRIWEDAVQFLEQNDSRVRSEVQNVAGEDCRVWRWLATGNHTAGPSSPRNKSKVWQGQAFETQEGSVNNLPVSPTPCLKIRQMIDKHDDIPNLKSIIQDAILEKCGDDCNILHVYVDQQLLCVYVKCASRKDAGIAYRKLHGCWFDGKLITVKYVRLERYMERFPDSPSNPPYLKPSNNKKLSLQFFKVDNSENL